MMSLLMQLVGQPKDLGGGFTVRRLLPSAQRQGVGPFLFMDHFGPVTVEPGGVQDIRPHPHIGLATVTYLFEGAFMHRDSLGFVQRIEPGAINWMTAGHGIVHSERAPDDLRSTRYVNHGLQLWAALPREHEETAPDFKHTPAADLPEVQQGEARVKVLIGTAFGATSPVVTFTSTVYLDVQLPAGTTLALPALAQELAVYPIDADIAVDGEPVAMHTLAVLATDTATDANADLPHQRNATSRITNLSATHACRLMVIGGDALDAPRFMWWNFVSSRKHRLAQAAQDWSGHVFGYVVGETEMIALPERRAKKERRVKARPVDRRD
jgi:redox-sensitive bicupin YhaK (pirin superfamily)